MLLSGALTEKTIHSLRNVCCNPELAHLTGGYCNCRHSQKFWYKTVKSYLSGKIDEVVGLINQEDLQRTSSQVVATEVDFTQLCQRPLEILTT